MRYYGRSEKNLKILYRLLLSFPDIELGGMSTIKLKMLDQTGSKISEMNNTQHRLT